MRTITTSAIVRIAIGLSAIGIGLGAYQAGREAGISYGYNRGYMYGFSACRACDRMMNSTKTRDVSLPAQQLDREDLAFQANEHRFHLNAFNDRYLDPAIVDFDNGDESPRTRIVRTREGEGNLSYLCGGWKRFYGHALPKIGRRRGALPVVAG